MRRAPVCVLLNAVGVQTKVSRLCLVTRKVFGFFFIGLALPGSALLCSSSSSVQSLGFGSSSRFGWVQSGLTMWFNRVSG